MISESKDGGVANNLSVEATVSNWSGLGNANYSISGVGYALTITEYYQLISMLELPGIIRS